MQAHRGNIAPPKLIVKMIIISIVKALAFESEDLVMNGVQSVKGAKAELA
jgi:hypothetical protein